MYYSGISKETSAIKWGGEGVWVDEQSRNEVREKQIIQSLTRQHKGLDLILCAKESHGEILSRNVT